MDPIFIVWLLIIAFYVSESRLRQGASAKSYAAGKSDQKTSFQLGLTYGAAIVATCLSPILNHYQIGQMVGMPLVRWAGLGIMVSGWAIHIWAMRVLGQFYTRTLRTTADQHIVRQGPYRLIRHPGYLGSLVFWIGAGLATGNWIVAGGIALAIVFAYRARIRAEETMLLANFGQAYKDYSRQTWKLIPFLF